MKILLLVLAPLFMTIPNNRVDISWLDGQWQGLGYQPYTSGEKTWTIDLKCNTAKDKFTIEYPSLDCGGKWTVVESFENRVIFREKIQEGIYNCMPTGIVIVTRVDDDNISYSYFVEKNGKRSLDSFSTLKRIK
ncbi:MAG: hypothetical protein GY810_17290 [Aureispira sp.]|nr:hypothetical protein [Aureispira sp.]